MVCSDTSWEECASSAVHFSRFPPESHTRSLHTTEGANRKQTKMGYPERPRQAKRELLFVSRHSGSMNVSTDYPLFWAGISYFRT